MLRLRSTPRLRSFIHTQRPTPSSVYLDPTRSSDASTSSTPDDLSPTQRKALEAALRVDQAGEVAANYIYAGQFAVLRRDPATAALIQASLYVQSLHFFTIQWSRICGTKKKNTLLS